LRRAAVAVALLGVALVAAARAHPTAHQAAVATLQERKVDGLAPHPLAEPVHLRAASASLGPNLVPLMLAEQSGELARENLSVDLVTAQDSDSLPLLTRGDLDVVVGVPSAGFFNATSTDLSVRWVSGLTTAGGVGEGIYARRDVLTSPEFPSWADLRRHKVGTLRGLGGMQSYVIGRHLLEAGLDPNQVEYVRLRSMQDIYIALKNGSIDAGWLAVPMSIEAADLPELVYLGGWASDDRLTAVFFGPTLLERNREAGIALVRAMQRTINAYLRPGWAGDTETAEAVAALVATPVEQLRATAFVYDLELPSARAVRRIQRVFSRYPDLLKAPEPLPDERVVDRRFTDVVFEDDPS
jgi:NitT/TauT family transport system substrate-binding protein